MGVKITVLVGELPQRCQKITVYELHDGIQVDQPVFNRGTGDDQRVFFAELPDILRGNGRVIFYALGFIQDDKINVHFVDGARIP